MTSTSRDFIRKCREAIAYDWENDQPADPRGVEDLFEWFDEQVASIKNLDTNPFVSAGSLVSLVKFKDDSSVSVRQNPLSNELAIMDQDQTTATDQESIIWINRTTRADYVLFAKVAERQHASTPN